jgi:hypothetical protein
MEQPANGNAHGDADPCKHPVCGAQEPRRHLIDLAHNGDVSAYPDGGSERPPTTDCEAKNQATQNQKWIQHD